ncbi:MAG: hypothetical protein ACLT76_18425 [Clostridium fessum]
MTTSTGHFGEVRAFLTKYYGAGIGQDIKAPLDTITAQDRFGLVTIYGTEYQIVDIGLRMLEPGKEAVLAARGFPDDYIIVPTGLRREALSESGAGAALRERCVSAVIPTADWCGRI